MTEQTPTLTRHDLEAKIVKRCWENEAFRKEFIDDPAGAFVKYLQVPAADLPKIVGHEEHPGSWHIVLPAKPAHAEELSERDLEKIAGGSFSQTYSLALTKPLAIATSAATVSGLFVGSGAVVVDKVAGW